MASFASANGFLDAGGFGGSEVAILAVDKTFEVVEEALGDGDRIGGLVIAVGFDSLAFGRGANVENAGIFVVNTLRDGLALGGSEGAGFIMNPIVDELDIATLEIFGAGLLASDEGANEPKNEGDREDGDEDSAGEMKRVAGLVIVGMIHALIIA